MSFLPPILFSKVWQPFIVLQSSAAQSCLPILRSVVDKALAKKTVILFSFLHSPSTLIRTEELQSANLRLLDWTAQIPGYTDEYIDPCDHMSRVLSEYQGTAVDVIIDSVDTLLSNVKSLSKTYKALSDVLAAIQPASTSSRLIVHVLAPCPLIPLLAEVRLSPSLAHVKSHPPVLLTHIFTAYLTPPLPLSSPEKFWSIFSPISERHHDVERLVFGTNGEGSGGSEIVVELVVRSTGRNGQRRGVERVSEGWVLSSSTACALQELQSLKALWTKKIAAPADVPDPTRDVSFNLNLTVNQQHARSRVPLPYVHEDNRSNVVGSVPATILYDPDSADDIDDDDPDEDLDL